MSTVQDCIDLQWAPSHPAGPSTTRTTAATPHSNNSLHPNGVGLIIAEQCLMNDKVECNGGGAAGERDTPSL